MNNSLSNTNEPLKFFENFFLFGGFQRFYDDFFDDLENQERGYELAENCELFGFIMVFSSPDEFGRRAIYKVSYSDELETKLEKEFQVARRLLMEAISEHISKFNDADKKITLWAITIQEIYNQNNKIVNEYPVCVNYLNKLLAVLNSRLGKEPKIPLLNIPLIKQDLIKNLFSFLIVQKILSEEEYNRLQYLISAFIKDFSDPEIKDIDMIDIKDENKTIVRLCFYLLYDNVPRSRGKQDNFITFLKSVFVNFQGDKSLNSHFADIPIKNEDWYPELAKRKIEANLTKPKYKFKR